MSAVGMTKTILATQLAEAIRKDESDGGSILRVGAGKHGPAVSAWIESVAEELCSRNK